MYNTGIDYQLLLTCNLTLIPAADKTYLTVTQSAFLDVEKSFLTEVNISFKAPRKTHEESL